jgi:hypothetical protein
VVSLFHQGVEVVIPGIRFFKEGGGLEEVKEEEGGSRPGRRGLPLPLRIVPRFRDRCPESDPGELPQPRGYPLDKMARSNPGIRKDKRSIYPFPLRLMLSSWVDARYSDVWKSNKLRGGEPLVRAGGLS